MSPDHIADVLAARGYAEVVTYSFVDAALDALVSPRAIRASLANPIASDMAVLRSSLWPGLIAAARENLSHQRARFKLFEIGQQFEAVGAGVRETAVVAGLAVGSRAPEHWDGQSPDVDFFDVKGDLEALLQSTGRSGEFRFTDRDTPCAEPGKNGKYRSRRRAGRLARCAAPEPTEASRPAAAGERRRDCVRARDRACVRRRECRPFGAIPSSPRSGATSRLWSTRRRRSRRSRMSRARRRVRGCSTSWCSTYTGVAG